MGRWQLTALSSPSSWALPAATLAEIFREQLSVKAYHQTTISINLGFQAFLLSGGQLIL